MIVKIERHNEKQKWWLFDNIAKTSCSKQLKYSQRLTPSDLDENDDHVVLLDHSPSCNCRENEACSDCVSYYRLICRTKDDQELSIVFDTIAYICNDDGRTVEKIVANYSK